MILREYKYIIYIYIHVHQYIFTYIKRRTCNRLPRSAGEKTPNPAKITVTNAIPTNCGNTKKLSSKYNAGSPLYIHLKKIVPFSKSTNLQQMRKKHVWRGKMEESKNVFSFHTAKRTSRGAQTKSVCVVYLPAFRSQLRRQAQSNGPASGKHPRVAVSILSLPRLLHQQVNHYTG